MYPYVAPHTAKIHTLITLGIRHRTKPLVLKDRKRLPRGFDSHRPLHFSLPDVSLRCPRTRTSLSPSSRSLDAATIVPLIERVALPSRPSVIDPKRSSANVKYPAAKLALLLRDSLARFLELLPVRRVLERLIVLVERIFRVAFLHEQIAPGF